MRDLKAIRDSQRGMDIDELKTLVKSFTIQEKIEFSPCLDKDAIKNKIKYLSIVQVPNREVLLNMEDEDVVFYWLQNWIHTGLAHWVYPAPRNKQGTTRKVRERDGAVDSIRFYENGQFMYNYTMKDIEDYVDL